MRYIGRRDARRDRPRRHHGVLVRAVRQSQRVAQLVEKRRHLIAHGVLHTTRCLFRHIDASPSDCPRGIVAELRESRPIRIRGIGRIRRQAFENHHANLCRLSARRPRQAHRYSRRVPEAKHLLQPRLPLTLPTIAGTLVGRQRNQKPPRRLPTHPIPRQRARRYTDGTGHHRHVSPMPRTHRHDHRQPGGRQANSSPSPRCHQHDPRVSVNNAPLYGPRRFCKGNVTTYLLVVTITPRLLVFSSSRLLK